MSRHRCLSLFAIAATIGLSACRAGPGGSTASPSAPALATSLPGTAALPAPGLNNFAWDDRSPFRAGLVMSQQAVLDGLPGATVYHIAITLTESLDAVQGHEAVQFTNATGAPLDQVVFHLYPNLGSVPVTWESAETGSRWC